MEDRVGEVLAQRAALDRSPASGIALSIALHAAATAAVIWTAFHQPPPVRVGSLQIRFAPSGPAAVARKPKAAEKTPRLVETPPAVEQPKPEPVRETPPGNVAPPSPFGRSEKAPGKVAPPPPPLPAGVSQASDIAVGSSGVTGLEGGDFPYTVYIENMKRLIGGRFYRPQVAPGATTTVHFVINRNGTIRDARTSEASGASTLDRAALRAVLESSPLPPLPVTYSGTYLGVHLTFK